jgi:prepilin-type N-terminal cleavage/methylation domain-containing protein
MRKGFTIIELLVVVAIIGLLSSMVLTSVGQARKKARDSERRQTLRNVQKAFELYYNDNGKYPLTPGGVGSGWHSSAAVDSSADRAGGEYIVGLAPKYVSELPRDPFANIVNATNCPAPAAYWYKSDGRNYKLLSHCANETYTNADGFFDPVRSSAIFSLMVCSGEPACSSW